MIANNRNWPGPLKQKRNALEGWMLESSQCRGEGQRIRPGKQARSQRQAEPDAGSSVGAGVDTATMVLGCALTTPTPAPSRNSRLPWTSLPHWLASRQASLQPPSLPSTQMPPGAPFLPTEGGTRVPAKSCQSHSFLLDPNEIMITLNGFTK